MAEPAKQTVLRIAAESGVDERTILRYLSGYPVRASNARAIEGAIAVLGLTGIIRGEASAPTTKRGES
jgi:hypothetical protein